MNNKYLIIIAVTAILFIGAGCSKTTITIKENTQTATQTSTEPILDQIIQKPTVSTTILIKPTSSIVDCGTDLNCLTVRATKCEKTKYLLSKITRTPLVPGQIPTLNMAYEITGMANKKCNFFYTIFVKLAHNDETTKYYMEKYKLTKEEIEKMYAKEKLGFEKYMLSLEKTYCQTDEGKNIAEYFKNFLAEKSHSTAIGNIRTYDGNITCEEK